MEPTSNNDDQFLEERGAIFDIRNINIINPSLDQDGAPDSHRVAPEVPSSPGVLAMNKDPFLESMETMIDAYGSDDQDLSIDHSSISKPRPPLHTESSSSSLPAIDSTVNTENGYVQSMETIIDRYGIEIHDPSVNWEEQGIDNQRASSSNERHREIHARGFDSLPLDVLNSFSLSALNGGRKYIVESYETYVANATIAPPIPRTQMSAYHYATQEIRLFFGEPSGNPTLEKLRDAMVAREEDHDFKMHEREQWLHKMENQIEPLFGGELQTDGGEFLVTRSFGGLNGLYFEPGVQ